MKMNCSGKRIIFFLIYICFTSICLPQVRSLHYYLEEGLQNSPFLKDLQSQLSSASIDSLIIRAQNKPRIEWNSLLLYSPYNDHFGYDEVITDGGNYESVGFVSQNIFNRRTLENKYQSINTLKQSVSINKNLTTAELKRTITNLYLESFSVYSDLAFNRSFYDLLTDQSRILSEFVKAGIGSQADYLALLVETQGQEIIVNQLKNQYEKDIRSMNEICGLTDTSHVELLIPEIKLSGTGNPSGYLFLKQYALDSIQIINERNALNLRYKPSINWFADAGILTSNPWKFYKHFGASAGISLSVPIFDGQQRKLEEMKLALRENTRSIYKISSIRRYDQQYIRLAGELEGIKEIRLKLEKQLTISDQLVKSLRSQLETGIIKMTDYLNALKSYRNINHNLNMTDIEMLSIINEMNYILSE